MDELKKRDEIEPEAYTKLNDYLSQTQGLGIKEDSSEDDDEETVEEQLSIYD